jgi:hypothetical protein
LDRSNSLQKKKKEFTQTFTPKIYQYHGIANHQEIQNAFKEVSTQVVSAGSWGANLSRG